MGRYVPPALRKLQEAQARGTTPNADDSSPAQPHALQNLETNSSELQPRTLESLRSQTGSTDGLSVKDIHEHFRKGGDVFLGVQSTLNSTADEPTKLGYIMLFFGANPRWDEDRIIFAKTKVDLLPGFEEAFAEEAEDEPVLSPSTLELFTDDGKHKEPSDQQQVAVFQQSRRRGRGGADVGFKFTGWFCIDNVDFLHPFSEELARMLSQKWKGKDQHGHEREIQREAPAWQRSLGHRWAVIKMKELEDQPPTPDIEPRGS